MLKKQNKKKQSNQVVLVVIFDARGQKVYGNLENIMKVKRSKINV